METLSSQVLEFDGKDNPIGGPFLGKLPVLSANVRLDWKIFARPAETQKSFITMTPGAIVGGRACVRAFAFVGVSGYENRRKSICKSRWDSQCTSGCQSGRESWCQSG